MKTTNSKFKKGAMEMSVGTIVVIVLSVTMLVLGVVFIKNLFSLATGVADLTDEQLKNEINKLFSEESRIVIVPNSRFVQIKQENEDHVGVGIQNLLEGASATTKFSYNVYASEFADCGTKEEVEDWIILGKAESNFTIPTGQKVVKRIRFRIPVGSPLCSARFNVDVFEDDGTAYATDSFDIEVKAK